MLWYLLDMNIPHTHISFGLGYSVLAGTLHFVALVLGHANNLFGTLVLGQPEGVRHYAIQKRHGIKKVGYNKSVTNEPTSALKYPRSDHL
jgi:hypothetical protein